MNRIKEHLGDLWAEKSLIEHENYEVVMAKLKTAKTDIMDIMDTLVKSDDDMETFESFWPFDC